MIFIGFALGALAALSWFLLEQWRQFQRKTRRQVLPAGRKSRGAAKSRIRR